jgi:hypothetical protein
VVGTAEFSHVQMARPPKTETYLEFFKAKHTTQYLESYVDVQNLVASLYAIDSDRELK